MKGSKKECSFGDLIYDEEGFLVLSSSVEQFSLENYEELLESIKELSNGQLLPYMSDERGKQRYMDNDSKKYINDHMHKYVSACAIMEDSAVLRFLTHTFVAIYRPKVPIRMFKSENEARKWMKSFI